MLFNKKLILSVLFVVLILIIVSNVFVDDFSKGVNALKKDDYDNAKEFFKKSCNNGNDKGCYNIGLMYAKGLGVEKDNSKAGLFFKKACDGGHPNGCYLLGLSYAKGYGVKQDYFKAAGLFKKICNDGDARGCEQYELLKSYGY